MHQQRFEADIISMEALNLEVIGAFGRFQQLVLYQLNDDIFTVEINKNISRSQLAGACPTLDG